MQSKATTVKEYLASLPADRRVAIETVRNVVNRNLDKTYQEGMQYGMIGWSVPHSVFPPGYHCDPKQPLPFAGLASQANYMSLYLPGVYCGCMGDGSDLTEHGKWFQREWAKAGKKLDMGKVCIRFKKVEDLALDVVAEAIRRIPAKVYVEGYLRELEKMGKGPDGKALKAGAKRTAGTKVAGKQPAPKGAAKGKRTPARKKSKSAAQGASARRR